IHLRHPFEIDSLGRGDFSRLVHQREGQATRLRVNEETSEGRSSDRTQRGDRTIDRQLGEPRPPQIVRQSNGSYMTQKPDDMRQIAVIFLERSYEKTTLGGAQVLSRQR